MQSVSFLPKASRHSLLLYFSHVCTSLQHSSSRFTYEKLLDCFYSLYEIVMLSCSMNMVINFRKRYAIKVLHGSNELQKTIYLPWPNTYDRWMGCIQSSQTCHKPQALLGKTNEFVYRLRWRLSKLLLTFQYSINGSLWHFLSCQDDDIQNVCDSPKHTNLWKRFSE